MYNVSMQEKKTKRIFNLPNILIFVGILFLLLSFGPLIYQEIWYFVKI